MCSFVLSLLDYRNSLLIGVNDISCNQMYRLQKVQTMQQKLFFTKADTNSLHWLPVKERIIFKTATFVFFPFCFCFLFCFDGTLPPNLSPCLFVYILSCSCTLCFSSESDQKTKTLSCARWKLEGLGYQFFSVQAPLV